ncbi:uncharacterized protein LOC100572633 isoform X1 [Acyrthosiphon pisum]|uniref:THAP-type domain-containing protein n=1 Tax=Acyrthosiphon pisum TaxID=7029 RepID=A0A8R1W7W0_ACYPI|nr:uncharacterized protein LOC100572633 isoform X1 [Acyrthosiphon pisum]|eukprot:XP_003248126.1 PREDICTED: uncharacterized protein LOC100572633 isoform X1 [Acyrthosiphon pisum]
MTRKCVVCNKLYIKGSDETFHSFPKDETRKKMWLKACKIKLCLPSNKICGDHFLPEHYLLSGYLTKDAVPFLAPTSMNKPLNAQCTSSPCPIPIKLPCIERTASTSTDKPLNDQCTSSPCPIPMKSSCVKPIASMNTDITYSPESRKRKILNSSTIGALSPSHFSSPRKAKRHLDMVKNKFKEKQVQNNNLKNKIYRLKKKIEKDGEYIQSLNRLLKEKEHKEILNANIIGALTPSQLISAKKAKTRLDTKKNKFKERQIENGNLKNQIQSPKNYTVQQDHDYTIFT